ncbi:MAG: PKD domain-containing protein, partial [Bacteroidales bacterium]|nr:PKD domain-containing protein [Bacteroidales bacterium]
EYFMKFPNVKNVTGNTILTVEAYNGDTRNFIVGGKRFDRFSRTFGPDKVKTHKRNGARKYLNEFCLMYNEMLERGDFLFIISTDVNYKGKLFNLYFFSYDQGVDIIRRLEIIKNQKTSTARDDEYLTDSVLNRLFSSAQIDTMLNGIDINMLNDEIENTIKSEINENKSKLELPKNNNINVTPFNKSINMACPDPWAVRYSGDNYTFENCVQLLNNHLNPYGYTITNNLVDGSNGDNDFGNFTFENFSNFLNSGISWLETHGDQDGYISLVYADNLTILQNWFPNELSDYFAIGVLPDDEGFDNGWDGTVPFYVLLVDANYLDEIWASNNAGTGIVILGSCYGGSNGLVNACGENKAVLADENLSYTGNTIVTVDKLLKRMNGNKHNGSIYYRSLSEAFNNIVFLPNGLQLYPPDPNITLCPATKTCYPANNASVIAGTNSGYFEIDTWCDASIPASSALSLDFSEGDLWYNPATDVYWENPVEGKSNKIIYNWAGFHGIVRVNINTNNIIAYGGGEQKLDFDRKAPNGETDAYYVFNVGYSNVNTVDFVASQYEVLENTEIQFTNQSTVIDATSYYWDFGDGTNGTQENPTHTYSQEGTYDVTLRVSSEENEYYNTKNGLITVKTECSGDLYASYNILFDKTVKFYASYSGAYEPLVYEYRFNVYFGDGNNQSISGISNMLNLEYDYADFGDYYPVIVVESIDQFGETLCIKE